MDTGKIKVKDKFLYIYIICICLYIFNRANALWFEKMPELTIYFITIVVSLLKIVNGTVKLEYRRLSLIMILFVFSLMMAFVWYYNGIMSLIWVMAFFLAMTSVIMLPIGEKRYLLKVLTNCFVIILLISIPAWILYLVGFQLPHSNLIYHSNGFHIFYDYYFFRLSAKTQFALFPRFSSIFLEPGQLATPCAFLWFLNGANFSRKNIILLVGLILSFSLIGYGLMIAGFITARLYRSARYRLVKVVFALIAVIAVSLYFSRNENSDDPVKTFIVSRLEYDTEKVITGNNRTSEYFDIRYELLMKSSDKYWGIYKELKEGDNWTYNCSGYKKFIVHRGIIGFAVFLTFIFLLFWYNRCLSSFVFLILLLAGFFVRDMLQTPLWLSIAILGFYIFYRDSKTESMRNGNVIKTGVVR